MTQKEILKCLYDYETCHEHHCGKCSAYDVLEFNGTEYYPCQLFNILQYGRLLIKEEEK